jgi:low affinity Fe/Cu permease
MNRFNRSDGTASSHADRTGIWSFVLQRSQYRDSEAIQAKLDLLLHEIGHGEMSRLDERELEEIELTGSSD